MKLMTPQDERHLVQLVERTITMSTQMSPCDALTKLAREEKLPPEYLERIAQAFNKTYVMNALSRAQDKEAAVDATRLISVPKVAEALYGPTKQEKTASLLPVIDLTISFMKTARHEAPARTWTRNELLKMLVKTAGLETEIRKTLEQRVLVQHVRARQHMEKAAKVMQTLLPRQLIKTAQLIHNRYPEVAPRMMAAMRSLYGLQVPEMQKQASTAVFPAEEPYVSIVSMFDAVHDHSQARRDLQRFEKESLFDDIGSSIDKVIGMTEGDPMLAAAQEITGGRAKALTKELPAQFFNQLKTIEARETFAKLMLYDKDLSRFDYNTLVDAYNDSVSSVPDASGNPAILKSLMLQRINTGGVVDPMQMAAEQKIQESKSKTRMETAQRTALEGEQARVQEEGFKPEFKVPEVKDKPEEKWSDKLKALREAIQEREKHRQSQAKGETDIAKAKADTEKSLSEAAGSRMKASADRVKGYVDAERAETENQTRKAKNQLIRAQVIGALADARLKKGQASVLDYQDQQIRAGNMDPAALNPIPQVMIKVNQPHQKRGPT